MAELSKKQLELAQSIARLFFEKIEPNIRFQNDRINEWCDRMPTPPRRSSYSADAGALVRIEQLHESLCQIDARNTIKGHRWPKYVQTEAKTLCKELKSEIEKNEVDGSILNLWHMHFAALQRARGRYALAHEHIESARELLLVKIKSTDEPLPAYTRNSVLFLGDLSALKTQEGDVDDALRYADEMLAEAERLKANEAVSRIEQQSGICSLRSWALFHLCQGHLAVTDFDSSESTSHRSWAFTETFGGSYYKEWNVPTLVTVLRSEAWKERYPEYHDTIADLLYTNTATGPISSVARGLSVSLGRVSLRPLAPVVLFGLIAVIWFNTSPRVPEPSLDSVGKVVESFMNEALAEVDHGHKLPQREINEVRDALEDEAIKQLEQLEQPEQPKQPEQDESKAGTNKSVFDLASILMVATSGNEHGVGVGIQLS